MTRNVYALSLFATFAGLLHGAAARAGELPRVRVDAGIKIRFNVRVMPAYGCAAPWYSYFPYDPNLASPQQSNPYPNWPSPFPPAEGSSNDKSASRFPNWPSHFPTNPRPGSEPDKRQVAHVATAMSQPLAGQSAWQTSFSVPSGSLAPQPLVSGMQVPAYWYGR
jgi:hypothetical protein